MSEISLPLSVLLRLGHGAVQVIADDNEIDIVHLKGHSADPDLYRKGRRSTDVDVLVRPGSEELLVDTLQRHGWEVEARFATGSVFKHAAALTSKRFGHVDVHRTYPGLTKPADEVFQDVWETSEFRTICGIECLVPSRVDQAVFILLHSARDGARGPRDRDHLREVLTEDEWSAVLSRASAWGASTALGAALGAWDDISDSSDFDFWYVMAQGGSRVDLFRARWKAAPGLAARLRLLSSVAHVNRDHLAMNLGHQPTHRDVAREVGHRIGDVIRHFRHRRRR